MKERKTFKIRSEVWVYPGMAGWHFVSVSRKQSEEIKKTFGGMSRGWGSLPVVVTVGKTGWNTSIFPDKKAGVYILPLKADVRKKEGIVSGDAVSLVLDFVSETAPPRRSPRSR